MEVRRVEKAKPPAYPDKEASLRDPSLLLNAPERWKRNAAACAALAATSAILFAGCSKPKPQQPPCFIHGDGFAAIGGLGYSGGPMMTEEYALRIIIEEAEKEGLSFSDKTVSLKNITMDITPPEIPDKKLIVQYESDKKLTLDGYNARKRIGFEFISDTDIENITRCEESTIPEATSQFTVTVYPFQLMADYLSKGIAASETDKIVAVFYDPTGTEEDLRAQVRDFIAWLKAQGII